MKFNKLILIKKKALISLNKQEQNIQLFICN